MKTHLRCLIGAICAAQLNFVIIYLFTLQISVLNIGMSLVIFVFTYGFVYWKLSSER